MPTLTADWVTPDVDVPDHYVTFDHDRCAHDVDYCSPEGTVTCRADVLAGCRFGCDECEDGWYYCNNCEDSHPLSPHCSHGHRLVTMNCVAVDWLADDVTEAYDEDPTWWADGPIELWWTSDGPTWTYPRTTTETESS